MNSKRTLVETVNGAEIFRFVMKSSVAERDGVGTKVGRRHFTHTCYIVRRAGKDIQARTLAAAREVAK